MPGLVLEFLTNPDRERGWFLKIGRPEMFAKLPRKSHLIKLFDTNYSVSILW